jgi:carbonic anhydrase/acetyltransferase-like protein (isoleucine patch superfamily)
MIIRLGGKTPAIGPESWVAPNASVVGDVQVGARSGIWFGAVVRADIAPITIGDETNVQDNCVLHADPAAPLDIGDRVSVGHGAVLHGCTVEADVLVGMRATILNRARVGHGSLIAAGALVLEGIEIPPGSLVAGVPGRIRRLLTDEELERLRQNCRRYVELAREYGAAGIK